MDLSSKVGQLLLRGSSSGTSYGYNLDLSVCILYLCEMFVVEIIY